MFAGPIPLKDEIVFGWETVSQALADGLEDLIAFNWERVQEDPTWPVLEIDWPKYLMYERMGLYKAVSARQGGKLIAYNGYNVMQPARHRSTLFAMNDALYVDADQPQGFIGTKLLAASEEMLKAMGVQFILHEDMEPFNSTEPKPRATFGRLLLRRGYRQVGAVYAKRL